MVVLHLLTAMGEVLGHRDVHRAGATFEREVHGFLEDVAGVLDAGDQERALRRRGEHVQRVRGPVPAGGLVERPSALPLHRRIAGDSEHRVGVGHRDRQAREEVERPRSCGGEAEPELVGVHRIAAGHEGGGLFVPGDDRPDGLRVLQGQHQPCGVLSCAAERCFDPDALESLDDCFVDPHRPAPISELTPSEPFAARLGPLRIACTGWRWRAGGTYLDQLPEHCDERVAIGSLGALSFVHRPARNASTRLVARPAASSS